MVRGLGRFRDAFAAHAHQYTLIGGTACDLLLEQVDLPFRATKDLDIVLMSEMLDTSFARTFWEFVRAGRYNVAESTDGAEVLPFLRSARSFSGAHEQKVLQNWLC